MGPAMSWLPSAGEEKVLQSCGAPEVVCCESQSFRALSIGKSVVDEQAAVGRNAEFLIKGVFDEIGCGGSCLPLPPYLVGIWVMGMLSR